MMNKLSKILMGLLLPAILITGCDLILDVNSDRLVFPHEHQLDSPNDTIYSMIGIFSQLEKLATGYVLLGELRGDLMDVTEDANSFLHEINDFEITSGNPYTGTKKYYSVINHCNYLIRTIDTSLVSNAEFVMYKEFAAAKAIRAWTYMQLALNYGTVKYYEDPVLAVQDADSYIEHTIDELVPLLIQDLEPWKSVKSPGGISLGVDVNSSKLFIPIRYILGDLYMWTGDFEKAVREYYTLIQERTYTISPVYRSTWTVDNGVFIARELQNQRWPNIFRLSNNEQIILIAGSVEFGQGADLDSLSWYSPEIVPSATAIENWNSQTYYHTASVLREGDLRGDKGSYLGPESDPIFVGDMPPDRSYNQIMKFTEMASETSHAIPILRVSMLYLRYAEAVNRAGKPNLAFAVLKNGMSSNVLAVDTIVPRHEKYSVFTDSTGTFYDYVNFENISFNNNLGVRARGCGNISLSKEYVIPALSSLEDSILYVEDKIVEELTLETAFEGHRFHDLMRIALRRNDPAYLANIVAAKHTDNKEAVRSKLADQNNWYLPQQP